LVVERVWTLVSYPSGESGVPLPLIVILVVFAVLVVVGAVGYLIDRSAARAERGRASTGKAERGRAAGE
jgi:hypothetical protein